MGCKRGTYISRRIRTRHPDGHTPRARTPNATNISILATSTRLHQNNPSHRYNKLSIPVHETILPHAVKETTIRPANVHQRAHTQMVRQTHNKRPCRSLHNSRRLQPKHDMRHNPRSLRVPKRMDETLRPHKLPLGSMQQIPHHAHIPAGTATTKRLHAPIGSSQYKRNQHILPTKARQHKRRRNRQRPRRGTRKRNQRQKRERS